MVDRTELKELLAAIEHEQWAEWANGLMLTETLSTERVERWSSLLCEYKDLPEKYKEKDRLYADHIIELLEDLGILK